MRTERHCKSNSLYLMKFTETAFYVECSVSEVDSFEDFSGYYGSWSN